ncbi:translation initiation factor IF-2-like [Onychomys torridus]|uniref:translation initiation factor IF-2-like n=1 Tax=Onychomys torridus TaxID=38674 RepID=UPI00167F572A|nr:translation initiation factor IF-2-like [Onychomys torridus]
MRGEAGKAGGPGAGFLRPRPRPRPGRPIPGRPARGPASGLRGEAAPLKEPGASAGPRETGGNQGGGREGGNVRDPAGSRCASTRPQRWLRGHRDSDPRGRICPSLPSLRSANLHRNPMATSPRPGSVLCSCAGDVDCSNLVISKVLYWIIHFPTIVSINKDNPLLH